MIKAVVFDLDDTMYSYQNAHRYAFQAVSSYAVHQLGTTPEQFEALYKRKMSEHLARIGSNCSAIHNRLIRFQLMVEELRLPLSHAPVMESLYWRTLLAHMEPSPGLKETVEALKAAGYRIGVGTNMTADWQYEKLERLGLLDLIDFLVSSEEVNAEKPDRRLFLACVEKAGCLAQECLFLGDSIAHDVAGALGAGMQAAWYAPSPRLEGALPEGAQRISSLRQLPQLIAQWNPSVRKGGSKDEA